MGGIDGRGLGGPDRLQRHGGRLDRPVLGVGRGPIHGRDRGRTKCGGTERSRAERGRREPVTAFAFPSDDKELEAVIPDKICGATAQKLSLKGKQATGDDELWSGILQALGKSLSDVSAAAAFTTKPGCSVTIIKIKGADEGKLREPLKSEATKAGITYTKVSVGGKDVFTSNPAKFGYSWIKGDGAIIITADSAKDAEELVSALP